MAKGGSTQPSRSTGDESEAAEKEALAALMENALEMGANAVIDLKMLRGITSVIVFSHRSKLRGI